MTRPRTPAGPGAAATRDRLSPAELKAMVREVPDFPRPGVGFKDVTPIFADPVALASAIDHLAEQIGALSAPIDHLIGAEARGFILGAAVARQLGAGFIPTRKAGKLPGETHGVEYDLEYGTDSLHMHRDALRPGDRVVVHDDLVATGGTAAATARLARELGAEVVAFSFLVELSFLSGREALTGAPVLSLISFDG